MSLTAAYDFWANMIQELESKILIYYMKKMFKLII